MNGYHTSVQVQKLEEEVISLRGYVFTLEQQIKEIRSVLGLNK